jgi:hypothetical protein
MRSASTSMNNFLINNFNFKNSSWVRPQRDWKNGEGVEGYMVYPSSTAFPVPKDVMKNWVTNDSILVHEHILPIEENRQSIMDIDSEKRKVVIMKRDPYDSWKSQMNRSGLCPYDTRGSNKNECLESFKLFRKNIDVYFPESDGFLHVEFKDLIKNQDKEIKRILDYWNLDYDPGKVFMLPHNR